MSGESIPIPMWNSEYLFETPLLDICDLLVSGCAQVWGGGGKLGELFWGCEGDLPALEGVSGVLLWVGLGGTGEGAS